MGGGPEGIHATSFVAVPRSYHRDGTGGTQGENEGGAATSSTSGTTQLSGDHAEPRSTVCPVWNRVACQLRYQNFVASIIQKFNEQDFEKIYIVEILLVSDGLRLTAA